MSENSEWERDSTGEWRARTGTQHEIDTAKLRALDGSPCVEEEATAGGDSYNQSRPVLPQSSEKVKRRSLDDMRQLSEAIKNARSQR